MPHGIHVSARILFDSACQRQKRGEHSTMLHDVDADKDCEWRLQKDFFAQPVFHVASIMNVPSYRVDI